MGNSKGNRYSIELKKEVCEYINDHNFQDAATKIGLCMYMIKSHLRNNRDYPSPERGFQGARYSVFKHEDY